VYFLGLKSATMRVVNYLGFRNKLTQTFDAVNRDKEIVIVSRSQGKNVVVMDLDEYNSIQETLYLTSTKANRRRLEDAIAEMITSKSIKHGQGKK
jgi:antitoxin YefM